MTMELWLHAFPAPLQIRDVAKAAEDGGWGGLAVVDTQNLSGECFVALALAATRDLSGSSSGLPWGIR